MESHNGFFDFSDYKIISERHRKTGSTACATVKIAVGGKLEHRVAEGVGPINALERAMRLALESHHPCLRSVHLKEYWVRISGGEHGTASDVEVLIMFTDANSQNWTGKSRSPNIIDASADALAECFSKAIASHLPRGKPVPV